VDADGLADVFGGVGGIEMGIAPGNSGPYSEVGESSSSIAE
jgi:hypothetical protein